MRFPEKLKWFKMKDAKPEVQKDGRSVPILMYIKFPYAKEKEIYITGQAVSLKLDDNDYRIVSFETNDEIKLNDIIAWSYLADVK